MKAAQAHPAQRDRSLFWAMPALLLLALVVRIVFIGSEGFSTDVSTFEAWAMSLAEKGMGNFYTTGGFADYPPGYFYILAFVGWIWESFFKVTDAGHYTVLKILVKLPAIVADLGAGVLVYAIARRFAGVGLSIGAAAVYLLNPATIYNSAVWGQVDSIAGGLALLAVYLLLRSDDGSGATSGKPSWFVVGAWIALSYSLLIKPQAAVLLPLFIAFAFADPQRRRARLFATGIGIVAAFLLAIGLAEPFHPSNPVNAVSWLVGRYAFGSSVYPYNTVNAFNLWAIRGPFWSPDSNYILVFPQVWWGIGLVIAALGLIVWRYVQEPTPRAFLEGCAIATLGFFVLATRMHERYIFDGVLFTIACIPLARRYLWGAVVLTIVLFANLQYSLQYLDVVTNHVPNVDTTNMWGLGTAFFALLAVGTFFALGYMYLGGATSSDDTTAMESALDGEEEATPRGVGAIDIAGIRPARGWFDPREGLTAMKAPWDYVIMAAFGVGNFILSFAGYWWPPDKVFDEIYFARAGEEYLQNLRIYENTHPPLTKLMITLSIMLFGGMPHGHGLGGWTGLNAIVGHMSNGDNSFGWRFVDVVFSALVVMLLYAFAKRITGSTLFASIAALLLTADGMHFVQSRIATPEGIVVFFATAAVYAFYRFWISSQVGDRAHTDVPEWGFAAGIAFAVLGGVGLAFVFRAIWGFDPPTTTVTAVYLACGLYLAVRYLVFSRVFSDGKRELTFPDGSLALSGPDGSVLYAPDGGSVDSRGKVQRGRASQNDKGTLVYRDDDLTIEYGRDATVKYATPEGTATYANDEIRTDGGRDTGRASKLWLIAFTVALGLLVSSKWYGVMGFGVSFLVLIGVFAQRFFRRGKTALWGNPRGFRLDGALVTIVFVSATVYGLVWVPDLVRHGKDEIANFNDVVNRQYTMFEYHDQLKATHPYSSKWWEWPLDYVPVAYYYQDKRVNQSDSNACCIFEITSMPNPILLWFGLIAVPWVGVLAWRLRNKGYALIVLTYLLQWIPWAKSPRITFAYHFYVDIPLIALCVAIVLQRIWAWAKTQDPQARMLGGIAVGGLVVAIVGAFVFFYPVLAAYPLSWNEWHARMWIDKWILGPG